MAVLFYVIWFVIGLAIFNGFHKIFDVAYFRFGAMIMELGTIAIISFYITGIFFSLMGVTELPF